MDLLHTWVKMYTEEEGDLNGQCRNAVGSVAI